MAVKGRILTGDRPTGRMHLGHYVGSLANRVRLQDVYECMFIVADLHTLTTKPEREAIATIGNNVHEIVLDYLSDEAYSALQEALMRTPEAGPVIPGSGGVRKLRWGATGRGKRGGYRVIYYVRRAHGVIWMLTMYPKNVAENIPAHVLRQIAKEVEDV